MIFNEGERGREARITRLYGLLAPRFDLAERRLAELETLTEEDDGERFGAGKEFLFQQMKERIGHLASSADDVRGQVALAIALRYSQHTPMDTGVGIRPWRLPDGSMTDRRTLSVLSFWLLAELMQYRPMLIEITGDGNVKLVRTGRIEGELPIYRHDSRAVPFLRRFAFIEGGSQRARAGGGEDEWWAPKMDPKLELPFLRYPVIVRGEAAHWDRLWERLLDALPIHKVEEEDSHSPPLSVEEEFDRKNIARLRQAELAEKIRRELALFDRMALEC